MKKYILIQTILILAFTGSSFQIFKTSLDITVRDGLGNLVEGAKVQIYKTYDDFQEETNPVADAQFTDKRGRVLFKDLDAQSYYISVTKDDMNNFGQGEMVDKLIANRRNKVTIIIQ